MLLTPTIAHPPIRHGQGDPPPAQQTLLDVLDRTGLLGLAGRLGALPGLIADLLRYGDRRGDVATVPGKTFRRGG
jgi:amidase